MLYLTQSSIGFEAKANAFMRSNSLGKKFLTGLFVPAYANLMVYTLLLPDIISDFNSISQWFHMSFLISFAIIWFYSIVDKSIFDGENIHDEMVDSHFISALTWFLTGGVVSIFIF